MASGVYNQLKGDVLKKLIDLAAAGDTIKVALMNDTYTFDPDDDVWADVSAKEISGTGYTAGGATLANQAVTVDDANDLAKWDGDDVSWTNATFIAYHAVIYDVTAGNRLIDSFDFGGAQQVSGQTFTLEFHADGITTLS